MFLNETHLIRRRGSAMDYEFLLAFLLIDDLCNILQRRHRSLLIRCFVSSHLKSLIRDRSLDDGKECFGGMMVRNVLEECFRHLRPFLSNRVIICHWRPTVRPPIIGQGIANVWSTVVCHAWKNIKRNVSHGSSTLIQVVLWKRGHDFLPGSFSLSWLVYGGYSFYLLIEVFITLKIPIPAYLHSRRRMFGRIKWDTG